MGRWGMQTESPLFPTETGRKKTYRKQYKKRGLGKRSLPSLSGGSPPFWAHPPLGKPPPLRGDPPLRGEIMKS